MAVLVELTAALLAMLTSPDPESSLSASKVNAPAEVKLLFTLMSAPALKLSVSSAVISPVVASRLSEPAALKALAPVKLI